MKKLINSISFYIIAVTALFFTFNDEFNIFNVVGLLMLVFICVSMKYATMQERYDTLGITWLQRKFKNNVFVNNLTTEE